jgi:hypothetical protein
MTREREKGPLEELGEAVGGAVGRWGGWRDAPTTPPRTR